MVIVLLLFAMNNVNGGAGTVPRDGASLIQRACGESGVRSLNDPTNSYDVWVVCKDGSVKTVRVYK